MGKHNNITELQIGSSYMDIYLVKNHAVKTSSKNKPYLDITLVDRTGEINGKLWNMDGVNPDRIVDSDFIAVAFSVEEYNGNKQARINKIGPVKEGAVFDKSEIIPTSPEDPQTLYNEIRETAMSFNNEELKRLVLAIYDERKEQLLITPAAKSVHHSYIGGLLQHTAGMMRTAEAVAGVYSEINRDLLLTGVMLHDICKIDEFKTGPVGIVSDYTQRGKLMGHLHMGAVYIEKKCGELGISNEITVLVSHMLLSHHNEPEFGAVVRPATLEATMLCMIDMIDSRVAIFSDLMAGMEPGTFSQRVYTLGNVMVYKPNIPDQIPPQVPETNMGEAPFFGEGDDFFV